MNIVSIQDRLTTHEQEHASGLAAYLLVRLLMTHLLQTGTLEHAELATIIEAIEKTMEHFAETEPQKRQLYEAASALAQQILPL